MKLEIVGPVGYGLLAKGDTREGLCLNVKEGSFGVKTKVGLEPEKVKCVLLEVDW